MDDGHATIGFVGLGSMGGAMAGTLVRAGYRVVGFDPNAEALAAATDSGVKPATDARDVVAQCSMVLVSLRSSAIFVEVAEGELLPVVSEGSIVADLGTTEAAEDRRLAAAFAKRGARLLDVPVSGGPGGSATGTLHMFAGGDADAFEAARPVLETLGAEGRVVYCGPSGSGQVVKAVNQLAMGLGLAAYVEAMAFGVQSGVDPKAILQAVGGPDGFRAQFAGVARSVATSDDPAFYVKFPELGYFLREAEEAGLATPLTRALYDFLDPAERVTVDNMGRPIPSFWRELMAR
ncbi:3-hydroxyisobutyrate dehydrogenase [Candidatus Poribacteria bacterium]|nr:3-hydroxyisobutyrate dehydrogenase [Candidatus Poribacteria bacterium]